MRVLLIVAAIAALAGLAHAAPNPETRPPERPESPAFAGQTRAPGVTTNTRYQVVTVARGLNHPWGLAFLPDRRMLVTERPGRMRLVTPQGAVSPPIASVPKVVTGEQLGLYGLALSPGFD